MKKEEIKISSKLSRVSPQEWIEELYRSISLTCCRLDGHLISLPDALQYLSMVFMELKKNGKRLWWVGNGGSAALCSHLSQDCLNRLKIRSSVLSDASLLTCLSNDHGYENVYRKALEVLVEANDVLIAISSSGDSQNILEAVNLAKEKNVKVISFTGFSQRNSLWNSSHMLAFHLPSSIYGIVEVGHEALIHSVIESMLSIQSI